MWLYFLTTFYSQSYPQYYKVTPKLNTSELLFCCKSIHLFHGVRAPSGAGPHYRRFTITLRHTSLGETPLKGWSARRSKSHLTVHNIHNRQTSMPPQGFESAIPATERPQTHHSATGIGYTIYADIKFKEQVNMANYRTEQTPYHWYLFMKPRGFCQFTSNKQMFWNATCWQHCMSETGAHATWLYCYCLMIHIYWIVNTAVYLALFIYT
jgi:hypothetical protein